MNLLLIAGHGAGDPGATSNGYQEAVETRRVAQALAWTLKDYCKVSQYPTSRNAYSDYKKGQLLETAKFSQYNYVLEIHFNAYMATRADGVTMGVECYVPTSESNTATEEALCRNLAELGLKNRGVKKKDYSVIWSARKQGTRAALLEVCFIDDPDDMRLYESQFAQVVQAIANGIITTWNLKREDDDDMSYEQFLEYQKRYEAEKAAKAPGSWSEADRKWLEETGIMTGSRYQSNSTREETGVMLHRLHALIHKELGKG